MARWTLGLAALVAGSLGGFGCGAGGAGEEGADGASATGEGPGAGAAAVAASVWVPYGGAWATVERVSDIGDCQGVVPTQLPGAVRQPPGTSSTATSADPAPSIWVCWGGVSDGTGHIALSASGFPGDSWRTVKPDGTSGGWFWADLGAPLLPQASGWIGLSGVPVQGGYATYLRTFAPAGAVLTEVPVEGDHRNLAEDPEGGAILTYTVADVGGLRVIGRRIDAAGAPRWPAARTVVGTVAGPIGEDFFVGSGISTGGESVTVWGNRGTVTLVWRDRAGRELVRSSGREPVSTLAGAGTTPPYARVALQQMLDGSLALAVNGRWQRILTRLASASAPLPDWLAEHVDWSYRVTRGGRGYVILPRDSVGTGSAADCRQELVLASRNGRLCGRLTLHTIHGYLCSPGAVDQGWDGTVVRQHQAGYYGCGYEYFPRMLAP